VFDKKKTKFSSQVGGLHIATGVINYMSLTCQVVKLTVVKSK